MNIIECKGVYYSLDEDNKKAVSNKGVFVENVMIGNDKIKHYIKMKKDNEDLRSYLSYGLYDNDKDKQKIIKIVYKCLEMTNVLNDIITNYKIIEWHSKDHDLIPIKELSKIEKNIMK